MKAVFAALILTALPLASQADALDIKTGDWEVRQTTGITGVPIAKEVLDKLSPEEREKMEVSMRARADEGEQITSHRCVTQPILDKNDLAGSAKANCTREVVTQTARFVEFEETCTAPEPSKTRVRLNATSVESYTASTNRTEGNGTEYVAIRGRWIGPNCEKDGDN